MAGADQPALVGKEASCPVGVGSRPEFTGASRGSREPGGQVHTRCVFLTYRPPTSDSLPASVTSAEGDIMATPVQMGVIQSPESVSQKPHCTPPSSSPFLRPPFFLPLVGVFLLGPPLLWGHSGGMTHLPESWCPQHPWAFPPTTPCPCSSPPPPPGGTSRGYECILVPRLTALWGEVVGCIVWGSALLWDNYTIYCLS